MDLLPGEPWLQAKLPVAEWPADAPRWARTAAHGDRRVELGLIGMDADVAAVRRALRRALVTKAEFALGAVAWQEWEDKVSPFAVQQSAALPHGDASGGLQSLLGATLLDVDGNGTVTLSAALADAPLVALYFSAHWCGPCRKYTPRLVTLVEMLAEDGVHLPVIFSSNDDSEDAFQEYFASMPNLYAFPHGDERIEALKQRYAVSGIPRLVVLDAAGNTVVDAVATEALRGPKAYHEWLAEAAATGPSGEQASDDASDDEMARDVDATLLAVTAPPLSVRSTDKIVIVSRPNRLAKIMDAQVQLAVWRRASPPKFVATLSDPSIAPAHLPRYEGLVAASHASQAVREGLRAQRKLVLTDSDVDELVDDVCQLVRLFAKLTKSKKVFVKLECLADNGCQFWHQDSVSFRLVTTYRGPCTEWVHPDVSKATLRRRSADCKDAQSLCHHDVALFKGRGETAHGDALLNQPGIVHRSPHIAGSGVHRVVLVLDIPRPEHTE